MQVFNTYHDIPASVRGSSAALGNFDGVHLGHQSVIKLAATRAEPLSVISFEPHPRQFFAPDGPPFRLMNAASKAHRLAKMGAQFLFDLPFNSALSSLTADAFALDVLANGLGLSSVTVGADFRFGKGRGGDAALLKELGTAYGFDVQIAPYLSFGEIAVSSTAIRTALAEGRPRDAAKMLGHWHRIEGPVLQGERRGRDLGFPTANLALDGLHLPRLGVYAVWFDVLNGPHKGSYRGAASLGTRPTFGNNTANLEIFVLDFSGNLYGSMVSVALVEFLRPELKFDGLDPLIAQMNIDVDQVRDILNLEALP